jgi:hypothetical protein
MQALQISSHTEETRYSREGVATTQIPIDEKFDSTFIAFPDPADIERAVKAFTHLWKLVRGPELFDN